MKKSNKILLGGFLTAVLLLAAVHIGLFAKYKNGAFTAYNEEDDLQPMSLQSFPHIKFVSVKNVNNVQLSFADTARVESMDKEWMDVISLSQSGDTLHLTGPDVSKQPNTYYRQLSVFVPQGADVNAVNSSLSFQAYNKFKSIFPLSLHLNKSRIILEGHESPLQLGDVSLIARNESSVELRNVTIKNMDATLQKSSFVDTEGSIEQLSIVTDSISQISLQTKHLLKAKLNSGAH